MVADVLPNGKSYYYEYDAHGAFRKKSDNLGQSLTVERDASGALIATSSSDGKWSRATRDEAGRIITTTNSEGKSRHFAYNVRGAITSHGAPGAIPTRDLPLRRRTLYATELREHTFG